MTPLDILKEAISSDNEYFKNDIDNDRSPDWVPDQKSLKYERILLTNIAVKPKHDIDEFGYIICQICGASMLPKSYSSHCKTRLHLGFKQINDKLQQIILS